MNQDKLSYRVRVITCEFQKWQLYLLLKFQQHYAGQCEKLSTWDKLASYPVYISKQKTLAMGLEKWKVLPVVMMYYMLAIGAVQGRNLRNYQEYTATTLLAQNFATC